MELREIFSAYKEPHHLAALDMLEEAIDPALLDIESDWIVCFFAEPDPKEPLIMVKKP